MTISSSTKKANGEQGGPRDEFVRRRTDGHEQRQPVGCKGLVARQLQMLRLVGRGFKKGHILLWACSLTYMTLLSIVPLLALAFSILKAFGGLEKAGDRLMSFIMENLAAGSAEKVSGYLADLVENVNAGGISGVSVLALFWTVSVLLSNIEKSLNEIWGVRTGRPLFQRFTHYTVLVVLGPLLLSISLSAAVSLPRTPLVNTILDSLPFGKKLLLLPPFFFTWTIFTLAYRMLPNTMVRLKTAVVGGVAAGTVWELAKLLYIWAAKSIFIYGAIYGSLAAFPIFLVWIYITWLIFLCGAQLTFAGQNIKDLTLDLDVDSITHRAREFTALRLMLEICKDFFEGRPARPIKFLTAHVHIPERVMREVARILTEGDLIVLFETEDGPAFIPARPLNKILLTDVLSCMRSTGDVGITPGADPETMFLQSLQDDIEETMAHATKNLDFQQLVRNFDEAVKNGGGAVCREADKS